jgi:malate dehydrogenase
VTIVILGAGEIGGATARQVAASGLAAHVVLVDDAASVARGKALDIAQAGPVEGSVTQLTGTDDVSIVLRASVVVVADRFGDAGGEWSGEAGLALLARVASLNRTAPVLCAGPGAGPLIDRWVRELGLPASRIFGTAPEALRAAVVALVALEVPTVPRDVSLIVVGRAPDELIVPWDSAAIAGQRAVDVLTPPVMTRIDSRLPRLWPPGPIALASAAAGVVASLKSRAPRLHVLDVALVRGETGPGRPAMLPARVGPGGLEEVTVPVLPSRDRVRLDTVLAR